MLLHDMDNAMYNRFISTRGRDRRTSSASRSTSKSTISPCNTIVKQDMIPTYTNAKTSPIDNLDTQSEMYRNVWLLRVVT